MQKPYPESPQTFGEHLRKQRLDSDLTQDELAEKLGVFQSTVDRWERGNSTPPVKYRLAITAFLGFDPFEAKG